MNYQTLKPVSREVIVKYWGLVTNETVITQCSVSAVLPGVLSDCFTFPGENDLLIQVV